MWRNLVKLPPTSSMFKFFAFTLSICMHEYDIKFLNFTFYWERKKRLQNVSSFLLTCTFSKDFIWAQCCFRCPPSWYLKLPNSTVVRVPVYWSGSRKVLILSLTTKQGQFLVKQVAFNNMSQSKWSHLYSLALNRWLCLIYPPLTSKLEREIKNSHYHWKRAEELWEQRNCGS